MAKRFTKSIICPECDGSGVLDYTNFHDGYGALKGCDRCGGSGETYENNLKKIRRGKGKIRQQYEMTDKICSKCHGSGNLEYSQRVSGKTLFGTEYTKLKEWQGECDACFGTKKELLIVEDKTCQTCGGSGKISFWKKGLFSDTEYLKYKTCPKCYGSKKEEYLSTYRP